MRRYKIFRERFSREGFNYLFNLSRIPFNYFAKLVRSPFFIFKNKKYRYFYHPHHRTWMTERAVEIPIILEVLKNSRGPILEIGNVLKHYIGSSHDVVDKYEKEEGVINEDVATYRTSKKYGLIISISTMEHVGWDEEKSEDKIPQSIKNLKKLLGKDGKIVITAPLNYNPWLDKLLEKGDLFEEAYFMRRKTFNQWVQADWKDVKNCGFNEDARGLAILVIR